MLLFVAFATTVGKKRLVVLPFARCKVKRRFLFLSRCTVFTYIHKSVLKNNKIIKADLICITDMRLSEASDSISSLMCLRNGSTLQCFIYFFITDETQFTEVPKLSMAEMKFYTQRFANVSATRNFIQQNAAIQTICKHRLLTVRVWRISRAFHLILLNHCLRCRCYNKAKFVEVFLYSSQYSKYFFHHTIQFTNMSNGRAVF